MEPPKVLDDVRDRHGGFTAVTRRGTLWRPGMVLEQYGYRATLESFDEDSWYQSDDDVTCATYRVKGYGYPIHVWYSNNDGHRIA